MVRHPAVGKGPMAFLRSHVTGVNRASVGLLDGSGVSPITLEEGRLQESLRSTIQRSVPAPNDLYYDPRDRWGGAVHQPAVDGR